MKVYNFLCRYRKISCTFLDLEHLSFLIIIFAFLAQTLFTNNFNNLRLLILGTLLGCFTLIREDGATLIFPIIIIFISLLFFKIKKFKFIILTCIWIILGISLPVNLYKLINFFKYGDFVGVELREKNYNNAANRVLLI